MKVVSNKNIIFHDDGIAINLGYMYKPINNGKRLLRFISTIEMRVSKSLTYSRFIQLYPNYITTTMSLDGIYYDTR